MPRKPKTDQARLPKKERAKEPPRFMLTARDTGFVQAILEYRFLHISQMVWLFPDASRRGMENRLRYLYHNKYLERIVYPESVNANRLVYAMAEKGANLLAETDKVARNEIAWHRHLNKVSLSHIEHMLAINDVLISFSTALAGSQGKVDTFKVLKGDPASHKLAVTLKDENGRRYEAAIVPDAVIGIKFRKGEFGLFFVEVDRATMSTERWQAKMQVYYDYSRSPELPRRFKTGWFLVLTVTTSPKRIMSLAERTVAMGGKRAFCYTTADNITPDTVTGRIWTRASALYEGQGERVRKITDYARAAKISVFDAVGG